MPGDFHGTVHIRVRADSDEQAVLAYAYRVLRKIVGGVCIQIEKDWTLDNAAI